MIGQRPGLDERVMGSDSARAVGRFSPSGVIGYRAATMPNAPVRSSRAEAMADERDWLETVSRLRGELTL